MKYRTMSFYKEFSCIGGICEDSCCENWEIDLDDESVKLYKRQKGEFGKRLKDNMRVKDKQFTLNGTRCPFLNDQNLCDIFTEMGEECLCQTCTNFPRHIEEFENLKEVSLTISCPEACRIMLRQKNSLTFECREGKDEEYGLKPMKPLSFIKRLKENKLDEPLFDALFEVREQFFSVLQNRNMPVRERAYRVLSVMSEMQENIEQKNYQSLTKDLKQKLDAVVMPEFDFDTANDKLKNRQAFIKQILNMYDGLEIIKPEWTKNLLMSIEKIQELSIKDYHELRYEFEAYYKEFEYEFEHLLVYYIFNYFLGAAYDGDALTKVKFAVLSYMVIWELDFVTWLINDKKFGYDNQVVNAHAYSKEVEHSYNNFESLQLILSAHPLLSVEELLGGLI